MSMQGRKGYTLLEVVITLSIIMVLLCAAPTFLNTLHRNTEKAELFTLQRLLQTARSNAVTSGHITTLCGSTDGTTCAKDWHSPTVLIFEDTDKNHILSTPDKLIQKVEMSQGQWHWRGSNRSYLRFSPDGRPLEWGRFTECPLDQKTQTALQIVLNIVGRPYVTEQEIQSLKNSGLCI